MNIILSGQYPRSEKLIEATRDFERGRIQEEELGRARRADAKALRGMQTGAGFPYLSTGLFCWQDLMRPFAEILPGSLVEGLKRFYETNTFWKVLECRSSFLPLIDEARLDEWVKKYFLCGGMYAADEPLVVTLPFIYLFKEYSTNFEDRAIAGILAAVAQKLLSLGNKLLVFAEPTFGWRELTAEEKRIGRELIEKVMSNAYARGPELPGQAGQPGRAGRLGGFGQQVVINTYFFDIEKDKDFLYSLAADGIGIDFYANSIDWTADDFPSDKMLVAGVLATDSTHVEKKETLAGFFERLGRHVDRSRIWASSAGPMELLPRAVADEKLENLKEAAGRW